jgi:1,6-anhydro-N-acetylmuramate kinase
LSGHLELVQTLLQTLGIEQSAARRVGCHGRAVQGTPLNADQPRIDGLP